MTAQLSQERRDIIEQTANHIISRKATSEQSENLKAVAELALLALAGMDSKPVAKVETVGVCWYADNGVPRKPAVGEKLYAAPPAPVADDYFASLVTQARARADKAMRKFPQPNYVLNKVAEESGEVIKAAIHYTEGREEWRNVEGEIIDNLAMLIRLVQEGDQVIGFTPPTDCRAAMLKQTCTCPSGDGSLRWPCPDHPPEPVTAATVPDGWKLVPVEPTLAMLTVLGFTGSFESMKQRYEAMLAAAPQPQNEQQNIPGGWIKCSERMPDAGSEQRVCAYTPSPHIDVRFRMVKASMFKQVCCDATHWQYMAAPEQEE